MKNSCQILSFTIFIYCSLKRFGDFVLSLFSINKNSDTCQLMINQNIVENCCCLVSEKEKVDELSLLNRKITT